MSHGSRPGSGPIHDTDSRPDSAPASIADGLPTPYTTDRRRMPPSTYPFFEAYSRYRTPIAHPTVNAAGPSPETSSRLTTLASDAFHSHGLQKRYADFDDEAWPLASSRSPQPSRFSGKQPAPALPSRSDFSTVRNNHKIACNGHKIVVGYCQVDCHYDGQGFVVYQNPRWDCHCTCRGLTQTTAVFTPQNAGPSTACRSHHAALKASPCYLELQ